jgi:hypothetical protein
MCECTHITPGIIATVIIAYTIARAYSCVCVCVGVCVYVCVCTALCTFILYYDLAKIHYRIYSRKGVPCPDVGLFVHVVL